MKRTLPPRLLSHSRGRLAWVGLTVAVSACSAELPEPREADVAAGTGARATLDELWHGRRLVMQHCANCHALRFPNALPPEAWANAVHEMRTKRGVRLSSDEAHAIVSYLETMAARGR